MRVNNGTRTAFLAMQEAALDKANVRAQEARRQKVEGVTLPKVVAIYGDVELRYVGNKLIAGGEVVSERKEGI